MIERLGRIRGVERLGRRSVRRSGLCFDPRCVRWVSDGNRLGVFMLSVMLFSVDLFVFLQILRTFEGLLADFANMGLERCMDCATSTDK